LVGVVAGGGLTLGVLIVGLALGVTAVRGIFGGLTSPVLGGFIVVGVLGLAGVVGVVAPGRAPAPGATAAGAWATVTTWGFAFPLLSAA
jgi:hypothetical protein